MAVSIKAAWLLVFCLVAISRATITSKSASTKAQLVRREFALQPDNVMDEGGEAEVVEDEQPATHKQSASDDTTIDDVPVPVPGTSTLIEQSGYIAFGQRAKVLDVANQAGASGCGYGENDGSCKFMADDISQCWNVCSTKAGSKVFAYNWADGKCNCANANQTKWNMYALNEHQGMKFVSRTPCAFSVKELWCLFDVTGTFSKHGYIDVANRKALSTGTNKSEMSLAYFPSKHECQQECASLGSQYYSFQWDPTAENNCICAKADKSWKNVMKENSEHIFRRICPLESARSAFSASPHMWCTYGVR